MHLQIFNLKHVLMSLNSLRFTNHSQKRCQQRGISKLAIEKTLEYGHHKYVKGAKTWSLSKQELCFLRADMGHEFKKVEKQLGFLIISHNNFLITVAHSYRRLRNK